MGRPLRKSPASLRPARAKVNCPAPFLARRSRKLSGGARAPRNGGLCLRQQGDWPTSRGMPGNGTSDPDLRTARLYGRLWRDYLRPYRGQIVVAFLFLIAEGSTLSVLSWLLKPLFDRVFGNRDASSLIWVGLAILGLFVLRAATSVISKYLLTRVAQYSTMAMQTDLLRHILTLDQEFFQINPPGALIERVQGDTLAVQGIWSAMITGFSRDSIALAGLFLVALTIDPVWTVAALIGAPLLIVPTLVLQKYIRRKTAAMREQSSQRATHLDEVFHGITAVKLNGMETYQTGRFARIVAAISRAEQRMQLGRTMIPALIDVVTGLGFFFVLMLDRKSVV